jgi:hypothetical protein
MKSKIQVDLDFDNQPIIVIGYETSEDVRDKMIERFLHDNTSEEVWPNVHFAKIFYSSEKNGLHKVIIRPLNSKEPSHTPSRNSHLENVRQMEGIFYAFCSMEDRRDISMITSSEHIYFQCTKNDESLESKKWDRYFLESLTIEELVDMVIKELKKFIKKPIQRIDPKK